MRSPLGSEGELHIIKGTQNESFIIYVLEIGFMEPNGSISLLQAKEERKQTELFFGEKTKLKGLAFVNFSWFNNKCVIRLMPPAFQFGRQHQASSVVSQKWFKIGMRAQTEVDKQLTQLRPTRACEVYSSR